MIINEDSKSHELDPAGARGPETTQSADQHLPTTWNPQWPESEVVLLAGGPGVPSADADGTPLFVDNDDLASILRSHGFPAARWAGSDEVRTVSQLTGVELIIGAVVVPWLVGASASLFVAALTDFMDGRKPANVKARIGRQTDENNVEWLEIEGTAEAVSAAVASFLNGDSRD